MPAASNDPYVRRRGGAGNGVRTRDPQLGRLMLYQLSYSRSDPRSSFVLATPGCVENPSVRAPGTASRTGGEGRIRTSEAYRRQIYSLFPLTTREPPRPHSSNFGTRPCAWRPLGAGERTRTPNPLITSEKLYHLSYASTCFVSGRGVSRLRELRKDDRLRTRARVRQGPQDRSRRTFPAARFALLPDPASLDKPSTACLRTLEEIQDRGVFCPRNESVHVRTREIRREFPGSQA